LSGYAVGQSNSASGIGMRVRSGASRARSMRSARPRITS
jgi:hypothetical protein